jgi:hypothetical protein
VAVCVLTSFAKRPTHPYPLSVYAVASAKSVVPRLLMFIPSRSRLLFHVVIGWKTKCVRDNAMWSVQVRSLQCFGSTIRHPVLLVALLVSLETTRFVQSACPSDGQVLVEKFLKRCMDDKSPFSRSDADPGSGKLDGGGGGGGDGWGPGRSLLDRLMDFVSR